MRTSVEQPGAAMWLAEEMMEMKTAPRFREAVQWCKVAGFLRPRRSAGSKPATLDQKHSLTEGEEPSRFTVPWPLEPPAPVVTYRFPLLSTDGPAYGLAPLAPVKL
jgi:hypothetical protein